MNAVTRKTNEWLQTHRTTIGGSNAAAAVGLHSFKTPMALYYEMIEGRAEDLENNPDALRGILLEPVCRQRLRDVLGMEIIEHDQNDFIRNDKYPFAHALPDGWIVFEGEKIPIELKVPHPRNWERLDQEVPDYIQCQAIHNAAIIYAPALMLCCLDPVSMQLFRNLYEPKQDAIDALMEAEERFMEDHIVPRVPPAPQTHEDLKLRWAEHSPGKRVTATEDIEVAWSELLAVRTTVKHAEGRKEDLSFTLKSFMEDAEILMDQYGKVIATYRSHPQTALDSKRLKEARPEIWAEFAGDKPIRTFRIKKPKG